MVAPGGTWEQKSPLSIWQHPLGMLAQQRVSALDYFGKINQHAPA
jgi:hypothetical protein